MLSIVFERTMKKLFASLVVAIAAMCFAPQATAAKLCATENMTTPQEVQVDVERGIVVIVEETIIDFPDNGSLVTPNITKNLIRVLLY